MDMIFKIAALAIVGTTSATLIKKYNPENALMLGITATAAILFLIFPVFEAVMSFINRISDLAGISPAIITPVIKSVGIAIITRIGSDVCKDAGQGALASGVELGGSLAALVIALPLFDSVISLVQRFI